MIRNTSAMDKVIERTEVTPSRRRMLVAGGGTLLVAGALFVVPAVHRWSRAERAVEASRLRIAPVVRGDLERDVSAQGRIVAALHPTLFAPAAGTVTLAVKAGTEVKQGQPLATVSSPELMSRLMQERSTLLSLQSDLGRQQITARQAQMKSRQAVDVLTVRLAAAKRTEGRAQETFKEGLLNRAEFEKAQDDVQIAQLDLKNAQDSASLERDTLAFELKNRQLLVARQESVVRELQRQADGLQMTAPFDGMVASVSVQDRDAVAFNQPVMMVVNLSAFEVEFDLPENYASDTTPGTPAEIQYEGVTYPGKVTTVSPEIKDSQVKGTLAFSGALPPGIRQSQRVTARLVFDRKTNVLKVPRGPFLESGNGRTAYVVDATGVAVRRSIEVGAVSVSEVEVVKGLAEGDKVVVSDTSVFEGAKTVLIRN
jgi:HlyD family secretion protein